jgi:hypothetical protein
MIAVRTIDPHPGRPVQEPERLASKRLVLVAVVFFLIFILATLGAVAIWRKEERRLEPQAVIPSPQEIGKPEIGMVNQRLFELQLDAKQLREQQMSRLKSYGWVDKDNQLIHIPIDRAMELLSREPGR